MKIFYSVLFAISFIVWSCNPSETENNGVKHRDSLGVDSSKYFGDSLTIQSRTYRFGLKNMGEGAEAILDWPVIVGGASKDIIDTINKKISFQEIAGFAIEKAKDEYNENGTGTVGTSFKINYNHKPILSLSVLIETMAAYSEGNYYHYNFNSETGTKIEVNNLIKEKSIPALVDTLNAILKTRIDETLKSAVEGGEEADVISEQLEEAEFNEKLNSFSIHKDGIIFYYDFGFPHAFEALEPNNEFMLTWKELHSWLKPEAAKDFINK
jgi:hypothetical protein